MSAEPGQESRCRRPELPTGRSQLQPAGSVTKDQPLILYSTVSIAGRVLLNVHAYLAVLNQGCSDAMEKVVPLTAVPNPGGTALSSRNY